LTAVLIHAECFVVFALPPIVGTKDILMAPLTAYQEEFGALPYDNAGAERALYKIHNYCNEEFRDSTSEMGFFEPLNLFFWRTSNPFKFDSTSEQIVDFSFSYFNQPKIRIARTDEPVLILVRILPQSDCEYITSAAQYFRVKLKDGHPPQDQLLGLKSWEMVPFVEEVVDICIDDPEQWLRRRVDPKISRGFKDIEDIETSCARRNYDIPFHELPPYLEERISFERMHQALGLYQRDHGFLPYDSRGGDFALYKLKEHQPAMSVANALPGPLDFNDQLETTTSPYLYANRERFKMGSFSYAVLIDSRVLPAEQYGITCTNGRGKSLIRVLFGTSLAGLIDTSIKPYPIIDPNSETLFQGRYIMRYFENWWEERDRFD